MAVIEIESVIVFTPFESGLFPVARSAEDLAFSEFGLASRFRPSPQFVTEMLFEVERLNVVKFEVFR